MRTRYQRPLPGTSAVFTRAPREAKRAAIRSASKRSWVDPTCTVKAPFPGGAFGAAGAAALGAGGGGLAGAGFAAGGGAAFGAAASATGPLAPAGPVGAA